MVNMAAELSAGAASISSWRSLAMLQAPDAIDSGNARLLMIFIGLVALAMVVIAIVVVVLAVVMTRTQKKVMGYVEEIKIKVMPIVDKSNGLIADLTPDIKGIAAKVHVITGHVEGIAGVAREKVHEFAPTISAANMTLNDANNIARDANQKTQAQVQRVNGMISGALDATAKLGKSIEYGITQPTREIAGVVSGLKAAMDSLLSKTRGFGAGITPDPSRANHRTTASSAGVGAAGKTTGRYGMEEKRSSEL